MKQYKERIQQQCGFPEPPPESTSVFSRENMFKLFAPCHAFSKNDYIDQFGPAVQYKCEKGLTEYCVIVRGNGERIYGESKSNITGLFTCTRKAVHAAIETHFNL